MTTYPTEDALPSDLFAERMILGTIMMDNTAFYEAREAGVEAALFSLDSNQRIFSAMVAIADAGRPIDMVTLSNHLTQRKEITSVGGVAYIASLIEGLPRRPIIREYIRIAQDKFKLRQIMLVSSGAIARAADQSESALDILGAVHEQILNIACADSEAGKSTLEISREYVAEFEREANQPLGRLAGVSLGTKQIDRATSGLMEGELAIVAGRPGSGKTEWAIQMIMANAREGTCSTAAIGRDRDFAHFRIRRTRKWFSGKHWPKWSHE